MNKSKKIIEIIILIIIIILGMFVIGNYKTLAKEVSGTIGELFSNDRNNGTLNWDTIPSNLFAENGVILWCVEKGRGTTKYMTAAQEFNDALKADSSSDSYNNEVVWTQNSKGTYDISSVSGTVYAHYRRSDSLGLVRYHEDSSYGISSVNTYNYHYTRWSRCGCHRGAWHTPYEGDDQDSINAIESQNGLPGISGKNVYSIIYKAGSVLASFENQDALFVLTALRKYPPGQTSLYAESLSKAELEEGGFNVVEKQYALWELGINIGNQIKTDYDRGLGQIAIAYQNFYNAIHNDSGEDKYEDIIEVSNGYDEKGNIDKEDIKETKEEIEGEEYKTYVYEKTIVETDTQNDCYVLGPFMIDYTVADEFKDTYHTLGTYYTNVADRNDEEEIEEGAKDEYDKSDSYVIKFNAIQNVTVYNQNKEKVTDLGGSFKLAYSYNGTLDDEAKITRINNATYVTEDTILNGEEITGIESLREFYIIVYREKMKPEEFTGFYAKFDFEYLESITGTLQEYIGDVYKYYYTKDELGTYEYTYSRILLC